MMVAAMDRVQQPVGMISWSCDIKLKKGCKIIIDSFVLQSIARSLNIPEFNNVDIPDDDQPINEPHEEVPLRKL
jgi:hypothetical protein